MIGLHSLYFLITECCFSRGSIAGKISKPLHSLSIQQEWRLGSKRDPHKGCYHSWFISYFKGELLISSEIRPHPQLTGESKTFITVSKGEGQRCQTGWLSTRQVYFYLCCIDVNFILGSHLWQNVFKPRKSFLSYPNLYTFLLVIATLKKNLD